MGRRKGNQRTSFGRWEKKRAAEKETGQKISSRLPSSVSIQHGLEPQERADDDEIDEMDEMDCLTEDAEQDLLNVSNEVREAMIAKLLEEQEQSCAGLHPASA